MPLDWATTQNNLGDALGTLGERQSGTEQLLQALRLTGKPSWSGSRAQSPTAERRGLSSAYMNRRAHREPHSQAVALQGSAHIGCCCKCSQFSSSARLR